VEGSSVLRRLQLEEVSLVLQLNLQLEVVFLVLQLNLQLEVDFSVLLLLKNQLPEVYLALHLIKHKECLVLKHNLQVVVDSLGLQHNL